MLDDAVPVLVQGISNLCRFNCQNFTSNHNNYVSCWQPMLISAKALAKKALQRIAFYRFRHLFPGNRKSEARIRTPILSNQNCNTGVATSDIVIKYLLEIESAG